jgi:hypothetical protein
MTFRLQTLSSTRRWPILRRSAYFVRFLPFSVVEPGLEARSHSSEDSGEAERCFRMAFRNEPQHPRSIATLALAALKLSSSCVT